MGVGPLASAFELSVQLMAGIERRNDRGGERLRIAGCEQRGVFAIAGCDAVGIKITGHDGGAGRHALQQHDTEALAAERGDAEHVGSPKASSLFTVVDGAEPMDAIVVGEPLLQLGGLRALPTDPQLHVGGQMLHRLKENAKPFAFLVPGQEEDRWAVGGGWFGREDALDLNAVGKDVLASTEVALGH